MGTTCRGTLPSLTEPILRTALAKGCAPGRELAIASAAILRIVTALLGARARSAVVHVPDGTDDQWAACGLVRDGVPGESYPHVVSLASDAESVVRIDGAPFPLESCDGVAWPTVSAAAWLERSVREGIS